MEFLSKLDPNAVLAIATLLATWLYHKLSGDKVENFTDLIRGVGKQLVNALVTAGALDQTSLTKRAQALMEDAFSRLGIPHNALLDAIAKATVEHAVGDALAELRDLAAENDFNLQKIQNITNGMDDVFKKAAAAGAALVAPMASLIERDKS